MYKICFADFSASKSVREFIELSKDWSKQELLDNALLLKSKMKKLPVYESEVFSEAVSDEINLFIDFLRKLLYYFQYYRHPAGMSEKDFQLILQIADRCK